MDATQRGDPADFDTREGFSTEGLPRPNAIHDAPPPGESIRVAEGLPPGLQKTPATESDSIHEALAQ